jgi:hypothetical protein
LQGLRDGKLLVGASAESAAEIDTATLESATPVGEGGPSFKDRMRSTWRYWDGNFDLGFNLQRATTDTTGVAVAFKTTRSKAPTRLTFSAAYRYAKEKPQDEDEHTTQDQALGLIRGEYDFTKRFFGFASIDALYDAIQDLSIRAVPKAGVGYVLWEQQIDADRRNFLSADIGRAGSTKSSSAARTTASSRSVSALPQGFTFLTARSSTGASTICRRSTISATTSSATKRACRFRCGTRSARRSRSSTSTIPRRPRMPTRIASYLMFGASIGW